MEKNSFFHTLESCWLCLKFPFLYPRDRFTDRHRVSLLCNPISKLRRKGIVNISITAKLEKESKPYFPFLRFFDITVKLDKENREITVSNSLETKKCDLKKLLWSEDKFDIIGHSVVFNMMGTPIVTVHVKTKDKSDNTNYGFGFNTISLVSNRFYNTLYNVLSWIDSNILDRILFVPTFSELDAMPLGWRMAFGIQMCEEIKQQLKKDKYLYKYRITQIKEKFGYLRWYDAGSSKEVQDIISKYEDISWNTCIVCGKPSTKITSNWICPYCDEHFPENEEPCQEKINGKWINPRSDEVV